MLRLLAHPEDHCYTLLGGYSTSWLAKSGISYHINFAVLVGPINRNGNGLSMPSVVASYDGNIKTSPVLTAQGDRNCSHNQISGNVYCVPFRASLRPEPARGVDYLRQYHFMYGSREIVYSHLLSDGQSVDEMIDCDTYPASDGPAKYHFRASVSGRSALVSYWAVSKGQPIENGSGRYGRVEFSDGTYTKHRRIDRPITSYDAFLALRPEPFVGGTSVNGARYLPDVDTTIVPRAIAQAQRFVNPTFSEDFILNYADSPFGVWNDLSQLCIDQLRYVNVNSISYFNELRDVTRMIPKMGSIRNPKTWANAYLCLRYGLNLTIQDTRSLLKAVRKVSEASNEFKLWTSVASSKNEQGSIGNLSYSAVYHYKVTYEPFPNDAMALIRGMVAWGAYPTLENCWDMIPLSFVVDWFVNVSSLLHSIDSRAFSQYFTVLSVCRSKKVTMNLPASRLSLSDDWLGNVTLTKYVRENTFTLDLPRYRVDAVQTFHNYAEALALIVQRH